VGPQTDGICAGFVASYADGDTVNMVGGKFINLQQDPNTRFVTNVQGAFLS